MPSRPEGLRDSIHFISCEFEEALRLKNLDFMKPLLNREGVISLGHLVFETLRARGTIATSPKAKKWLAHRMVFPPG